MQSSPILLAAILGTGSALLVQSRPAEACTCAPKRPAISPRADAVEVPTDATLFVATESGLANVELVTLDGTRVPLTIEAHPRLTDGGGYVKATPRSLAPNTTYELVVEWTYGVERSRFTTGLECDPPALEFEGLRGMAPEVMKYPVYRADGGGPCFDPCVEHGDHVSRIRLDFDRPRDAALVVFTLTRDDGTLVDEFALPEKETTDYVLGFQTCELRAPQLSPDAGYCGRITTYDIRGNAVGGDTEICTSTANCAPALSGFACIPSDRCDPIAPTPMIPASPETDDQPAVATETGGCSSTSLAGGLLAILVPALLPRRRVKRSPGR